MADCKPASQESLPLSQETYFQLYKELDGSINVIENAYMNIPIMDGQDFGDMISKMEDISQGQEMDCVQEVPYTEHLARCESWDTTGFQDQYNGISQNLLEQRRPISSLPASENWPGNFSFTVSFNSQVNTKGISWIFSKDRNKLYVDKGVPCPVNFSTSASMPEDVYIRAMALFSSPDQASEKVTRCVNHSMDDISKEVLYAEHFIRCESNNATYENDPVTGRHSVIVPFENPSVGQEYSTYLFKFMCYGSCSGGPNRRALMVVFTLERKGEVIGRRKIDLKVCACPSRDLKADNNRLLQGSVLKENKPLKRPVTDHQPVVFKPKKIKSEESEECYVLKTHDKKLFTLLRKIKKVYEFKHSMESKYPDLSRLFHTSSQSSSGEEA